MRAAAADAACIEHPNLPTLPCQIVGGAAANDAAADHNRGLVVLPRYLIPKRNGSFGSITSRTSPLMNARPVIVGMTPPVRFPILAREDAADDRLLPPDLARRQLSIGREAGELRAGAGAAGRAIVLAAGAEHKIPRVGDGRIARRTDQLDVVDLGAVVASDVLLAKCAPNLAASCRVNSSTSASDSRRSRVDEIRTSCRPRRRRRPRGQPRARQSITSFSRAIAANVLERNVAVFVKLGRYIADRCFDAMLPLVQFVQDRRAWQRRRSIHGRTCRDSRRY